MGNVHCFNLELGSVASTFFVSILVLTNQLNYNEIGASQRCRGP